MRKYNVGSSDLFPTVCKCASCAANIMFSLQVYFIYISEQAANLPLPEKA